MFSEKIINIAVFVAGIDEEYQSNIITGINSYVESNNINVSYFVAFGGMIESKLYDKGEYSIYDLVNLDNFDGVILMTNTINDDEAKNKIIERIKAYKVPAVVFDCDDYSEFYNISINNNNAMREIVRHVIKEHKAEVINYISGPMSNPEAVARLKAFREVMAENNLNVDENRIYYGAFRSADGIEAIKQCMKSGLELPDAFICANDAMALTAISTLEKYGVCVPDDVIVTGFDYTYSARNFTPLLTSVERPLSHMGSYACQVLMNLIHGQDPLSEELEASCVFTESCGCASQSLEQGREYRKMAYKKIEKTNRNIQRLNILASRLAEAESDSQLFDVVKSFVSEISCERFALCLSSNWQETYNSSYEEDIFDSLTAPLIWTKEKTESVEFFKGTEGDPMPLETGGNVNYYLPLHFSNKVHGYYIITNSDFPLNSLLCHTFSINVSHSIENIRKLSHIKKAVDELNRIYVIDPLCDIYNRNGFIKFADEIFRDCVKNNKRIMLTFIDMDGLKFINDNYGHDEGDFAIQRLAGVIKSCCRYDELCARFGGDEFVLFNSNATLSSAESLEKRFDAKLDNINQIINKPYKISASLGSYTVKVSEEDTLYKIIKQADELMYEVKKNKKNSRRGSDK